MSARRSSSRTTSTNEDEIIFEVILNLVQVVATVDALDLLIRQNEHCGGVVEER